MFDIIKAKDVMDFHFVESRRVSWPWRDMEVGDMVIVDDPMRFNSCHATVSQHAKRYGKKFAVRLIDGKLHVRRLK